LINQRELINETVIEEICGAIDNYLESAEQLFHKLTPYMHWLSHAKEKLRKDKCIGFFSTQDSEAYHKIDKMGEEHSAHGGGHHPDPVKYMAGIMKRENRGIFLKTCQSVKHLF